MATAMMRCAMVAVAVATAAGTSSGGGSSAPAGFGLTSSRNEYTVDTGAGLEFSVRRTAYWGWDWFARSKGGITSLKYNGVEYADKNGRYSTVNSGFDYLHTSSDSVSVDAGYVGNATIKVTVTTPHLTQYYIVKKDEPRIYMGTHWTKQPTTENQIRFIFRLNAGLLPESDEAGDINEAGVQYLEEYDVFITKSGDTRSAYYTNRRAVDGAPVGAQGTGVGMWITGASHEVGSGGPFYRGVRSLATTASLDLVHVLNDDFAQTEAFRKGTLAVYTLEATAGAPPTGAIDYGFYAGLGLKGHVAEESRGQVSGVGIQTVPGFEYTVGFANANAQYWTRAADGTGAFTASGLLPGTYTMTVYKNELAVHDRDVVVIAKQSTAISNVISTRDPADDTVIFRIGSWDGSPVELLNGANVTKMHPSDSRLSSWEVAPFVVGATPDREFPAYLFRGVNNNVKIQFKLPAAMKNSNRKLRIGTTTRQSGALPTVQVNTYKAPTPAKQSKLPTRAMTLGSYRGGNEVHEYEIPASAWSAGEVQTVVVKVESAKSAKGGKWLAEAVAVDCIDLVGQWETDAPTTYAPTSAPDTPVPETDAPSTSAPSTIAPSTSAPSTSAPKTGIPSTPAPSTSAPSTSAPSTSAPSTSAPSTSAPSTSAPSTSAPSTSAPSTSAPSTSAPSTSVPGTPAPPTGGAGPVNTPTPATISPSTDAAAGAALPGRLAAAAAVVLAALL
ncbi:putative rhamnogalacturonate lyase A [Diplonema papillatum]|nr:putative rhamnogalacturonate lyase A [Diplonema papillatum]